MDLTIVGSGTAAPEPERVCSGYFVDTGTSRVLMDCGPGVVHHLARFGLPWQRVDSVIISHFHNDHIGDVPMLLFALKWGMEQSRSAPLRLLGPKGFASVLGRMADLFGDHVSDPGCPLTVQELEPGQRVALDDRTVMTCHPTPHTENSLAFRLEGDAHGSIGYTGDTGPSRDVAAFMTGVDILLAECALSDDQAIPAHLSPTSLAEMATRAAPRRLVVSHVYPQLERQDPVALVTAAGWLGGIIRARDGLVLRSPDASA